MEERIEELEADVEYWESEYLRALEDLDEIERRFNEFRDKVEEEKANRICDLINFKRQLEIQKLMTPQLEEFIENYMRWSNV